MEYSLHNANSGVHFVNAKRLRKDATEAETLLWKMLRGRRFNNCKFRRQHPIKAYIADFYCHELKLVIELDGGYHNEVAQITADEERTRDLAESCITVFRLTNNELLNDFNGSLLKISQIINDLKSSSPSELVSL